MSVLCSKPWHGGGHNKPLSPWTKTEKLLPAFPMRVCAVLFALLSPFITTAKDSCWQSPTSVLFYPIHLFISSLYILVTAPSHVNIFLNNSQAKTAQHTPKWSMPLSSPKSPAVWGSLLTQPPLSFSCYILSSWHLHPGLPRQRHLHSCLLDALLPPSSDAHSAHLSTKFLRFQGWRIWGPLTSSQW